MGEDEFCFLLRQVEKPGTMELWIQKILHSFNAPFVLESCEIFISVCLGIARGNETYQKPENLLQDADTAMYQAKARGPRNYQTFDQQIHLQIFNRLILENDLQRALERQEFILYYQPIINLKTLKLAGFEALVRWQHPQRGMVVPGEFIPSMETTGLIVPVRIIILKQACQQLCQWQQQGWSELTMSVNLSPRQFSSPTLLADIDQVLTETGVNPANLKLELTESTIVALSHQLNLSVIAEGIETVQQLEYLQQLGCQFGQGYFFAKPQPAIQIEKLYLCPDLV